MLKLNHWIVTLSVIGGVFGSAGLVNSAPRSGDYFCYRRDVYGQVVNLTSLCQTQQTKTVSASTNTGRPGSNAQASDGVVQIDGQARRKKVEFSDYSYNGSKLVGRLRNRTGQPISDISIIYEVQVREGEGKWRTIDNGSTSTNNERLSKGGKTSFEANTAKGDRILITDVEFQ